MKFLKYFLVIVLALGLMLGVCACAGDTTDNTTDPSVTQGNPQDTTGSTTSTGDTGSVQNPTYTVKVVDEGGNPIAGAWVQLCTAAGCVPVETGADGVAEFFVSEDNYDIKFAMVPAGYTYPTEEKVFHFADGSSTLAITLKAVS